MPKDHPFDLHALLDPSVRDPDILDLEFPCEQFVTHFTSQGSVVHATVWIAQGREPKGTLILAPQLFGGDRLESVIIPLMVAGINVMTFHPRGMWDRQQVYTLTGAIDDLLAAAALVRAAASGDMLTLEGHEWRTDPGRIAVMGLSGGGGTVSLAACAEDPLIQSVIAVASAPMENLRSPEAIQQMQESSDLVKAFTAGRVDMTAMFRAMTPAEFDRTSPILKAPRLAEKNVLLVGAQRDTVMPLEVGHWTLVKALRDAGAERLDEVILESDHSFLTKRIALSRLIIEWLRQRCGF